MQSIAQQQVPKLFLSSSRVARNDFIRVKDINIVFYFASVVKLDVPLSSFQNRFAEVSGYNFALVTNFTIVILTRSR